MTKRILIVAALCLSTGLAEARDLVLKIPLSEVLAMPEAQSDLDGSIKFFLAGDKTPSVDVRFGQNVQTGRAEGPSKGVEFDCKWAALSALKSFQAQAKLQGANAVIDIVSFYRKNETKSDTTFECHSGSFFTGLTLKGTFAKVTP